MRRNSGDSYKGANASDGYAAISDEATRKIIHIAMGLIAAALGAIAIPSILKKIFLPLHFLH